jgi:hypothetical protein
MVFEKPFLSWLRERLGDMFPVFYAEADQDRGEPFAVLHTILTGATREAGMMRPLMQLDLYAADRFSAVELAETAVCRIQFISMASDGLVFSCMQAERVGPIRMEDGTWKVPIDIRFAVMAR